MTRQADGAELVEFSFVSRVTHGLPAAVHLRLASQCWQFNTANRLTGELRLGGDRFVYVVEGACGVVQPLAARILSDLRHGSIEITGFRRLAARRHSSWKTVGLDFEPAVVAPARAACSLRFLPSVSAGRMPEAVQGVGALTAL